ncbi:hypothetical protein [Enterococcus camelliae]|uniref:Uncharacterized protein n=1 Tax=Enterococcus camelliae TaxID=453959 RepID=A0ABW5TKN7_9ENTE
MICFIVRQSFARISFSVKDLLQEPFILTFHGSAIQQQIDYLTKLGRSRPSLYSWVMNAVRYEGYRW